MTLEQMRRRQRGKVADMAGQLRRSGDAAERLVLARRLDKMRRALSAMDPKNAGWTTA